MFDELVLVESGADKSAGAAPDTHAIVASDWVFAVHGGQRALTGWALRWAFR